MKLFTKLYFVLIFFSSVGCIKSKSCKLVKVTENRPPIIFNYINDSLKSVHIDSKDELLIEDYYKKPVRLSEYIFDKNKNVRFSRNYLSEEKSEYDGENRISSITKNNFTQTAYNTFNVSAVENYTFYYQNSRLKYAYGQHPQ